GSRGDQHALANRANSLLLLLGIGTFAVGVALGFIVYWSDDALWAIRHLAIPVTLTAVPLLVCGAFVSQHLRNLSAAEESAARGLSPAIARVAGAMVALSGAALMFGALVLAWPRPVALVFVGVINAAVMGSVALGFRLPHVHAAALPSFAIAFLVAFF